MLPHLTTSWTGHIHIKGYLTLILIWTWWPVRTETTGMNEKNITTNKCLHYSVLRGAFFLPVT